MGPTETTNMSIRALALAIAMFSIGVDATTYTKLASYADTSCTQLKNYKYYPESSSGTCTTLAYTSNSPYSVKTDGSSILAYSSVDCSGTAVVSLADTTSCVSSSKVAAFTQSFPADDLYFSYYAGTDATTSSCSSPNQYTYYPFDTCLFDSGSSSYRKYTSCSTSQGRFTTYGTDSTCATSAGTATANLANQECTVYNDGSTTAGTYEYSGKSNCASPTNSALTRFHISLGAIVATLLCSFLLI